MAHFTGSHSCGFRFKWATWGNRRRWITPDWLYCAFLTRRVQLPAERLSMRKIRGVPRLKHEAAVATGTLSRATG
ncbi:hypothetical protein DFAR_3820031 [Desulfarculales bacterium]